MVTPLYASLLTFILIFLIVNVIKLRRKHSVGLGDGGHYDLTQAIRAHGNFVETAPWGLFLMLLLDLQQALPLAIHGMGVCLVVGRILHIIALQNKSLTLRVAGMATTITVLSVGALYNFYLAI